MRKWTAWDGWMAQTCGSQLKIERYETHTFSRML